MSIRSQHSSSIIASKNIMQANKSTEVSLSQISSKGKFSPKDFIAQQCSSSEQDVKNDDPATSNANLTVANLNMLARNNSSAQCKCSASKNNSSKNIQCFICNSPHIWANHNDDGAINYKIFNHQNICFICNNCHNTTASSKLHHINKDDQLDKITQSIGELQLQLEKLATTVNSFAYLKPSCKQETVGDPNILEHYDTSSLISNETLIFLMVNL